MHAAHVATDDDPGPPIEWVWQPEHWGHDLFLTVLQCETCHCKLTVEERDAITRFGQLLARAAANPRAA